MDEMSISKTDFNRIIKNYTIQIEEYNEQQINNPDLVLEISAKTLYDERIRNITIFLDELRSLRK